MKEKELREHSACDLCGKKILASGLPLFWRVTVERFGVDMAACQRQHGIGLMLGAPLASVLGPDEDLAAPVMEPKKITVCETCATERAFGAALLLR